MAKKCDVLRRCRCHSQCIAVVDSDGNHVIGPNSGVSELQKDVIIHRMDSFKTMVSGLREIAMGDSEDAPKTIAESVLRIVMRDDPLKEQNDGE